MCNSSSGDKRNVLTHKAVILLSANRELNLKKRKDLIRTDLNKQYASLCNPSTAVSTFLFGDDLNKEVEELTKSHKVSSKVTPRKRMEPYNVPAARGVRGRGRFNQNAGRGRASSNPFFRFRPGTSSAPADSQGLDNQNPVGSPTKVSQDTIASITASQTPFSKKDVKILQLCQTLSLPKTVYNS